MALKTDLTGMLTEGLFQPTQEPIPSSYRESVLRSVQRAGEGVRRGVGALTGADTMTTRERANKAMQGLDINSPADQPKILEVVRKYAPEREAALVAQFAQQGRARAAEQAKAEAEQAKNISMAVALEEAGHGDLARQVSLGDTDAYKRGLELVSPQKGKTSIEDIVDPTTGVTHKVVLSPDGTILRTVGVSKVPKLKSVALPNGQIVWENEATGTRGEPQDTPEAADQERDRVDKLYSDLAAVDNVLVTVSEAKKLAEDESMTTGVFYNLASMPFATDARTLQTKITTLQSTLAFDRLQKMRDESKTGGALGQVSNIELQLLQSALTALDPIVGEEEFIKQLEKVQKHYTNFKKALLGEPLDIDWSRPEYKGKTTVVDGVRYMVDPADPTKVFTIGKK